jgi:hypothetical protein
MKKVKVTLKEGSTGRKFYLFPSPEALYVWACALERNEQVEVPNIDELVLEPGGFIEAELLGFEYVYEGKAGLKHKRLDWVRLGKAQQPENAAGLQVSIHTGWVTGNLLPLKRYSDAHIDIWPLDSRETKLDLPTLFGDEVPVVA